MIKKSWLLALAGMLALSVSGCMVTESTYLKKVEEAGSLEQGLATCKEEVVRLGKQNEELSKKVQDQQLQIGQLEKSREEKVQEVSKTYTQMIEKMKSEIEDGQVTITELQGRLTLNMVDAILFDSGRADIKPEGSKSCKKWPRSSARWRTRRSASRGTRTMSRSEARSPGRSPRTGSSRRPAPSTWPGISSGWGSIPPSCLQPPTGSTAPSRRTKPWKGVQKTGG